MSEVDERFVQRGLWTEWTEGSIMGKTITTDMRIGTVLVSLLAILASLATTHLWHIVTFLIHQVRARGNKADGLFWQQQAILRTLPTPSSLMADNVNLWWNWKGRVRRSFVRCLFQVILAAVFVSVALTATVATSFIVSSSSVQVLVKSPHCGMYNFTREYEQQTGVETSKNYKTSVVLMSSLYVDSCYSGNDVPSSCRNTFIKSRVPFSSHRAECPFNSSMCVENGMQDGMPAVAFDTGLLSMADVLGANLKKNEDVKFRKKTTCAVLDIRGRAEIDNITDISSAVDAVPSVQDKLSSRTMKVFLGGFKNSTKNATFTMRLNQHFLFSNAALPGWPLRDGDWIPIPELSIKDADTAIFLLSLEDLIFARPQNDPLYTAHRPLKGVNSETGNNYTAYGVDNAAGMLGCAEQYQYCVAHPSKEEFCTPLGPQPYKLSEKDFPDGRPVQIAALQLLLSAQQQATMAKALLHPMRINNRAAVKDDIPVNQWAVEAMNWKQFVLTSWQIIFTDYAIGPILRDKDAGAYVDKPITQGQKELCGIQRMRKTGGFTNINYFGLVFTIVVSLAIITIDITLLKVLVFMSRFRKALAPRLDRWVQDGVLQLQRRAFEAQGYLRWEQVDQEVPITARGECLPELSQSKRFVLKRDTTWEWSADRGTGLGVVRGMVGMVGLGEGRGTWRWSLG